MNKTLYIVADSSLLRAYLATQIDTDCQAGLEMVDELKPDSAHQRIPEQSGYQSGCSVRGGGGAGIDGSSSASESLNSRAEQGRRLVSRLAERITALLDDREVISCCIAIGGSIHHQLFDAIDPKARAKIGQVSESDLTKADPAELVAHFAKRRGAGSDSDSQVTIKVCSAADA